MTATLLLVCTIAWARADAALPKERRWTVDGVERVALVYTPDNASPSDGSRPAKLPVVFAFHGHGGNMRQAARSFGFHEAWPEAVVVYMQGLPTPGALTDPEGRRNGWQRTRGDQNDRDLKFFDAILASLKKELPVDEKRIFATGHSNGGAFTYLLWAERGAAFAAVAPVAAAAARTLPRLKPKPALHAAGRNDPLVRYAWQSRTIDAVRKLNGCAETGKEWATSGTLTATLYSSDRGTPFVSAIHPGGHQYLSGLTALIVRFFREQTAISLKHRPVVP